MKDTRNRLTMFRSKKKKIQSGSRRAIKYDDDDDENDAEQVRTKNVRTDEDENLDDEEPPSSLTIALQKRKAEKLKKKRARDKRKMRSGGLIVGSFDIEETDDNDGYDQKKRKKKKKRKRGLGFGGGGIKGDSDEDSQKDYEMGSVATNTTNAYGKDALEKLKSEQRRQTVPRAPLQSETSPGTKPVNGDPKITVNNDDSHDSVEESYIPLDDLGEDENNTSLVDHGLQKEKEKEKIFVLDDAPPDEAHDWERQIEQRAGIKASPITSQPLKHKLLSLDELSQKLKSTVEIIDRQREELENSTNRLRVDRAHAMTNSKNHQDSLTSTGLACEHYQSTRRDLTLWVGALRDLQEKAQPIVAAFREMLQVQTMEFEQEFRSWQDDCVATLYQTNMLDQVLGRQPESTLLSTASDEIVYDEFGRDIRSQFVRDRDLRFKERMEHIDGNTNPDLNSPTNSDIIKHEDHDEEERSKILQKALSAALEDLDEEYTSATNLKLIFDGWFASYFDDYQQCFATLSFGDLYAVFVQIELCKSNFFPDVLMSINDNNSRELQQPTLEINRCLLDSSNKQDTKEMETDKTKTSKVIKENEGRLTRTVEKGLLTMLVKIFNNEKDNESSLYLFFSSAKSSLISKLIHEVAVQSLQKLQNSSSDDDSSISSNSKSKSLRYKLQNLVSTAIKNALDGISIPLLIKDSNDTGRNSGGNNSSPTEALDCSIIFASVYQVRIIQQTLCNIIVDWFPLIDADTNSISSDDGEEENAIHYVLKFISEKYLVLLSSIENTEKTPSEAPLKATAFFKPIWEALQADPRNIVESPSLMMLSMPLRAAARAYRLN